MRVALWRRRLLLTTVGLAMLGCRSGDEPSPRDDGAGDGDDDYPDDTYLLDGVPSKLPDSFESDLPSCDEILPLSDLPIRLFADDGHLFYFEISPAAAHAGDERSCKDDSPPPNVDCPNFADNVRVKPFLTDFCADTGKIEVDLRGGDNFRPWLLIPTINFDSGEFSDLKFGQGDSQLRFQNGQGGKTILREAIALRVWAALGFPVPQSSFVKTQSNIWDTAAGSGTWAAHLLMQRYKKHFFDENMPDALHVWEGDGDPFATASVQAGFLQVDCEWSAEEECDLGTLQAVVSEVRSAPEGEGFYEATQKTIDWPSIHAFQCLAALTDSGNDWIHKGQNVVLVLTDEGKVRYLPYNLDTSGGYRVESDGPAPYHGDAYLIERCADDTQCHEAALQTCEDLLDVYDALDVPQTIVDERCETLERLELVRTGDAEVCEQMRSNYEEASSRLRTELSTL